MVFLTNWVLSFLGSLFLLLLCAFTMWIFYKFSNFFYSAFIVLSLFIKSSYVNFIRPILINILTPLYGLLKPLLGPVFGFFINIIIGLYWLLYTYILYVYVFCKNTLLYVFTNLNRYTYSNISYNKYSLYFWVVLLFFVEFFFNLSLLTVDVTYLLNNLLGVNNIFLTFFKLDNVIVSAYSCIFCIYLYLYIYFFVTFCSKFFNQYFNIFKISLGLFLFVAHTQLYANLFFYQMTVLDLLYLALFEALFLVNINMYSYTNENFKYSFTFFFKNLFLNLNKSYNMLSILNKQRISWTPIFKKTSYFGLYKSFRNKWPF